MFSTWSVTEIQIFWWNKEEIPVGVVRDKNISWRELDDLFNWSTFLIWIKRQ